MNASRGYVGWSKSVRAYQAEESGLLPLSRITGAPRWAIKLASEFVEWEEWHHTSKKFNITYYYDVEKLLGCACLLRREYGSKVKAEEGIAAKQAARWLKRQRERRLEQYLEEHGDCDDPCSEYALDALNRED